MVGNGYCRSKFDNCVYHMKLSNGSFVYLLLYVDDMLVVAKNMFEINKLKAQLSGEFEMKDLGVAKKILGVEIHGTEEQVDCIYHRKGTLRRCYRVLVCKS